MKRMFAGLGICAVAVVLTAVAEDGVASAEAENLAAMQVANPASRQFHRLLKFVRAYGEVSARIPMASGPAKAEEGRFYPAGTVFTVSGGDKDAVSAEFEFGEKSTLKTYGDAEFSVRQADVSDPCRSLVPVRGVFVLSLPRTLPAGLFSVCYPNFTAKDLAGDSRHELTGRGDGDEAVVKVVTGMMALEGANFKVEKMSTADCIRIRTASDALFTSLRGEAGDFTVTLDQGESIYRDPITGATSNQVRSVNFGLSPQCAVKIFRKRSQLGGRTAVSVMTFNHSGEMCNRFTFAEGAATVNFGEEVVRINEVSFKAKAEKSAKAPDAGEEAAAGESGANEAPAQEPEQTEDANAGQAEESQEFNF